MPTQVRAVAVVLSVWFLAGVFSSLGSLLETFKAYIAALPPAALYLVTALFAFAESAPALGLVIPGQSVIFLAGFLSATNVIDPFFAASLVAVGGFIGDVTGYSIGRKFGLSPLQILPRRLRPGEHAQIRLRTLFDDHGMKAIILARFQPIGRAFGPYFAGVSHMDVRRFLVAAGISSVVTASSLVGLGYLAGLGFSRLSQTLGLAAVSVVTVLLILVIAIGLRLRNKKEAAVDHDDFHTP